MKIKSQNQDLSSGIIIVQRWWYYDSSLQCCHFIMEILGEDWNYTGKMQGNFLSRISWNHFSLWTLKCYVCWVYRLIKRTAKELKWFQLESCFLEILINALRFSRTVKIPLSLKKPYDFFPFSMFHIILQRIKKIKTWNKNFFSLSLILQTLYRKKNFVRIYISRLSEKNWSRWWKSIKL